MLKQNLSAIRCSHNLSAWKCISTTIEIVIRISAAASSTSSWDICLLCIWSHLITLTFWHLQFFSMYLWRAKPFFLSLCYHGCEKCLFHRTHTIYGDDTFIRLTFLSNHTIKEDVSIPEKWKEQRKKKQAHFYSQTELWILQYSLIFFLVMLMIHSLFFNCY